MATREQTPAALPPELKNALTQIRAKLHNCLDASKADRILTAITNDYLAQKSQNAESQDAWTRELADAFKGSTHTKTQEIGDEGKVDTPSQIGQLLADLPFAAPENRAELSDNLVQVIDAALLCKSSVKPRRR